MYETDTMEHEAEPAGPGASTAELIEATGADMKALVAGIESAEAEANVDEAVQAEEQAAAGGPQWTTNSRGCRVLNHGWSRRSV